MSYRATNSEWREFIDQVVSPAAAKFSSKLAETSQTVDIAGLLTEAREEAIVAGHARDKKNGEAKLILRSLLRRRFHPFSGPSLHDTTKPNDNSRINSREVYALGDAWNVFIG